MASGRHPRLALVMDPSYLEKASDSRGRFVAWLLVFFDPCLCIWIRRAPKVKQQLCCGRLPAAHVHLQVDIFNRFVRGGFINISDTFGPTVGGDIVPWQGKSPGSESEVGKLGGAGIIFAVRERKVLALLHLRGDNLRLRPGRAHRARDFRVHRLAFCSCRRKLWHESREPAPSLLQPRPTDRTFMLHIFVLLWQIPTLFL